ncbi:glycoside hydrolase family 76 protein [Serpula lacrymans var. lacrymans S7.3]|uniref:Glycoside hydrolase family 76 protein n=2 Tax=Serpula lacrymans var. lacrymans TaxID=341189 RepID=F8PW97_SERL3|nr:glycoside hydrolase family 76 protein [Serpula lacrymans var. lacrymans S7.9]EGO00273.1 glycoside hydrolase family 76 protein [Serpula lacrymans var. lacrymans S7.3]EGO25830.1 glycoside hydrolase family 76 protein [Serpula lacrymans var. lacrymans S7.9]
MSWISLKSLALLAVISISSSVIDLTGALSLSNPSLSRRSQCQATLTEATTVANELQSLYYDSSTGQYNSGELWTDSNTIEDLHNLMLAADSDTWGTIADTSYIGQAANNANTDWVSFLGGSYDDSQWVILAFWKIADYKAARGQDNSAYLSSASKVYDIVAAEWDTTSCGGGVWWSSAQNYKNAITNQLFLLTSAEGYNRNQNQTYLDNANKEWAWLSASGMRGSDGLFNDGLDQTTCQNNGQTAWTYNQAVVASGLGALYTATGNSTLLDQAEISLDATISQLTSNNILKESCDDAASGGAQCDHDQQIFKGLWTKHVQYYLDSANDATRTAKYSSFLGSQYSAVIHYGMNANNDIGSVWYAPNAGGSVFQPEASAGGLEAIISNAKVCASNLP